MCTRRRARQANAHTEARLKAHRRPIRRHLNEPRCQSDLQQSDLRRRFFLRSASSCRNGGMWVISPAACFQSLISFCRLCHRRPLKMLAVTSAVSPSPSPAPPRPAPGACRPLALDLHVRRGCVSSFNCLFKVSNSPGMRRSSCHGGGPSGGTNKTPSTVKLWGSSNTISIWELILGILCQCVLAKLLQDHSCLYSSGFSLCVCVCVSECMCTSFLGICLSL